MTPRQELMDLKEQQRYVAWNFRYVERVLSHLRGGGKLDTAFQFSREERIAILEAEMVRRKINPVKEAR